MQHVCGEVRRHARGSGVIAQIGRERPEPDTPAQSVSRAGTDRRDTIIETVQVQVAAPAAEVIASSGLLSELAADRCPHGNDVAIKENPPVAVKRVSAGKF